MRNVRIDLHGEYNFSSVKIIKANQNKWKEIYYKYLTSFKFNHFMQCNFNQNFSRILYQNLTCVF